MDGDDDEKKNTETKREKNEIIKHIKIKMCTDISKSQQQVMFRKKKLRIHINVMYDSFFSGAASREWEKNLYTLVCH